jgi:hypothetical protein
MELLEYNCTGQTITTPELYDLQEVKQTLLQSRVSC